MEELNKPEKGKNGGARPGAGRKAYASKLTVDERKKALAITEAKWWIERAETTAVPFLFKLVEDEKAANSDRFKAAQEILNRCLGKPKENMDLTSKGEQVAGVIYLPKRDS